CSIFVSIAGRSCLCLQFFCLQNYPASAQFLYRNFISRFIF
ncbi:MAG: hypothetical protein AVDCRST_MAG96-701, partial [uncultured Segetibacter sp.]